MSKPPTDAVTQAMGPLPRTHGMLGAMLHSPEPHLTEDITADPRFRGWWPRTGTPWSPSPTPVPTANGLATDGR